MEEISNSPNVLTLVTGTMELQTVGVNQHSEVLSCRRQEMRKSTRLRTSNMGGQLRHGPHSMPEPQFSHCTCKFPTPPSVTQLVTELGFFTIAWELTMSLYTNLVLWCTRKGYNSTKGMEYFHCSTGCESVLYQHYPRNCHAVSTCVHSIQGHKIYSNEKDAALRFHGGTLGSLHFLKMGVNK